MTAQLCERQFRANYQHASAQTPLFWVGTSGFFYKGWLGKFYPRHLPSKLFLQYYSHIFPIIELNFTFYHIPSVRVLSTMLERTPPEFKFIVKVYRGITHELRTDQLERFLNSLNAFMGSGRLDALLLQFPQRFHKTSANVKYLSNLINRLTGYRCFVEFRHCSWADGELLDLLANLGALPVSVDVPDIDHLFPRRLFVANKQVYVRFHSRNKANWYADGKDRYDYCFSDEELDEWLDELQQVGSTISSVKLVFNNCRRAQAAANAQRVRQLIRRRFGPKAVAQLNKVSPGTQTTPCLFEL